MSEPLIVVDYGSGNLRSVETALRFLGAEFRISDSPEEVLAARRLIVPGVGEARAAMEELSASGLGQAIEAFWRGGRPLLGICLGCQIIFDLSEERGTACLGLLPGRVERFSSEGGRKVPHMGWNRVYHARSHPLFAGIADGAFFYFVHSYYPIPKDERVVIGECEYGLHFAAAVARDNLVACQFHPEKSGSNGLSLLKNFLRWDP
ncbi:MAG: imidazole glycerol phosphate synthase subunit HisH [Spirochaetia bacterium]